MKAELNIDTQELEERITKKVIEALKPLLTPTAEERLFTVKTLAPYLGVSEKWIYERVQLREIPYFKIGGNVRFRKSDINHWIETLKTPAVNPLSAPLKRIK